MIVNPIEAVVALIDLAILGLLIHWFRVEGARYREDMQRERVAQVQAQVAAACALWAVQSQAGPVSVRDALSISAACGLMEPMAVPKAPGGRA